MKRHCHFISICATLALLAAAPCASGHGPFADLDRLEIDVWTVEDGLPQISVNCIAETPDGYLWLGTFGGLVRFDGRDFTHFDLASTEALSSNRIVSLRVGSSGALWIGANDGSGVSRYLDGHFTLFAEDDAPAARTRVVGIVEGPGGVVWAGHAHEVSRFTGERFERVWSHPSDTVEWMFATRDAAWAQTSRGLLHLSGNGARLHDTGDEIARLKVRSGVVLGRKFVEVTLSPGASMPPASLFTRLMERPGLGEIKAIHVDRHGQVWCGTSHSGILRVREAAFEMVEIGHPFYGCSIAGDGEGGLWIGAHRDRGLFHSVDGEIVERILGDPATPMDWVEGLHRARDGTLWARHGRYLTATRGGRSVVHDLGLKPGSRSPMAETSDGAIWCGIGDRLLRIDGREMRWFGPDDGLDARGRISYLAAARDGGLWIGSDAAVHRLNGDRFARYDVHDGVPRGMVRALCEASDGSFWLGTYGGGLARLVDGRFVRYGVADGLPDNAISSILEDDRGNLWVNCNHGVFSVRLEALAAHVPGISPELPIRLIDCGEARGIGGCMLEGGITVFPTIRGPVAIDTVRALAPRGEPAAASIERILANGAPIALSPSLTIQPGQNDIVVGYTAPDLHDPAGLRFRHRLVGYDDGWTEAGSRREARYTHVPPGTYEFQVVATDRAGRSSAPAVLRMGVEPFFYETRTFKSLAALAVIALMWTAYRLRMRAVMARNSELRREIEERRRAEEALKDSRQMLRALSQKLLAARDEERRGIARELHDDVTQRLAALSIQAEILEGRMDAASGDVQSARDMARMAQSLADDIGRLSRRLHPSSLRDLGLARAMRSECDAFAKREGIPVRFTADEVPDDLPADVTLSTFRILQESLHNVEKHARAAQVEVTVRADDGHLTMTIVDTGSGFELNGRDPSGGIGLISMSERARAIGGRLAVESSPGEGTTVRLSAPLVRTVT